MSVRRGWRRWSDRFIRSTEGSSTIEAAIWMPILAFLLVLITDVSFIFYGRAEAMRIVQDGNRAFSIGRLTTEDETEAYIRAALSDLAPGATVTTLLANGVISTTVTLPVDDLMAIGTVPGMSGFNVAVASQHLLEA